MSGAVSSFWRSRRVQWLFEPKLTCICLVFLFLLTFLGTLYQVNHGLYAAQQKYYNSYFLLLGDVVPFPGTQTVLGVLLLNLTGYLLNMLFAEKIKFGIALIHVGLMMMIFGGAITHHFAQESQLTLGEGEASNVTAGYHNWELALIRDDGEKRDVLAIDSDDLKDGQTVDFGIPGIRVTAENYFVSCLVNMEAASTNPPQSRMNIAGLRAVPLFKEPERNIAGGIFAVQAGNTTERFLLFGEGDTSTQAIEAGGQKYWLVLRHRRFPMPLAIQLAEFKREIHPGTEMAKSYSSRVVMAADGTEREVTISMNKPLRHRGYTLYQASFSEDPQNGAKSSTFAVVHNYGRLLPYISTGTIVFGMVWHFVFMLIKRTRRQEKTP
jgi:hypothetical protein